MSYKMIETDVDDEDDIYSLEELIDDCRELIDKVDSVENEPQDICKERGKPVTREFLSPEPVQPVIIRPVRGHSRNLRGSCRRPASYSWRRTGRTRSRSSTADVSNSFSDLCNLDELNGWSYQAKERLPEIPVFEQTAGVQVSTDAESWSPLDCFSNKNVENI